MFSVSSGAQQHITIILSYYLHCVVAGFQAQRFQRSPKYLGGNMLIIGNMLPAEREKPHKFGMISIHGGQRFRKRAEFLPEYLPISEMPEQARGHRQRDSPANLWKAFRNTRGSFSRIFSLYKGKLPKNDRKVLFIAVDIFMTAHQGFLLPFRFQRINAPEQFQSHGVLSLGNMC